MKKIHNCFQINISLRISHKIKWTSNKNFNNIGFHTQFHFKLCKHLFYKIFVQKEPKLFNNNNMRVYTGECIWTAQPDLGFHHFMIIIFIYMYKYRSGMQ